MIIQAFIRRREPVIVKLATRIQAGGGGESEVYTGEYEVTPRVHGEVVLETKQKLLTENVRILRVPQYEVENSAKGNTLFIGENA